jgi:predicted DNA-binding mobile mystery protein A
MTYSFEKFTNFRRNQIDQMVEPWRNLVRKTPPKGGWIRLVRNALGMTTRQLAERLGVKQPRIVKIEKAEMDGSITLKSLRDAANALGCDLVYAVVPRKSIRDVLEERATTKAREALGPVFHNMALEAQSPTDDVQNELLKEQIRDMLAGRPSRLWENKP